MEWNFEYFQTMQKERQEKADRERLIQEIRREDRRPRRRRPNH